MSRSATSSWPSAFVIRHSSRRDDQAVEVARVVGGQLAAVVGDDDRVGVAEAAEAGDVEARLDREDHARREDCLVVEVDEGLLMALQADAVPGVVALERLEALLSDRAADIGLGLGTYATRAHGGERGVLRDD